MRPRRFTRGEHKLVKDRPLMTAVAPLHRTLEQELQALLRGASLECLVCGEFVLHAAGMIDCPECGSSLRARLDSERAQLQFETQAG